MIVYVCSKQATLETYEYTLRLPCSYAIFVNPHQNKNRITNSSKFYSCRQKYIPKFMGLKIWILMKILIFAEFWWFWWVYWFSHFFSQRYALSGYLICSKMFKTCCKMFWKHFQSLEKVRTQFWSELRTRIDELEK